MLLRESMLDSVIRARDRWMKPEGTMFPSHATMYWSAISYEEDHHFKTGELNKSLGEWNDFSNEMKNYYNIDMNAFDKPYKKEQKDYYIYNSIWTELRSEHVIGQPVQIKRLDLNKCTLEDSADVKKCNYDITVPFSVRVSGFAGWFTVDFAGSEGTKVERRVVLSTAPEVGYTHWGQQVFYLHKPIDCSPDTKLTGDLIMFRQEKNKRLYNVTFNLNVDGEESANGADMTYEIP